VARVLQRVVTRVLQIQMVVERVLQMAVLSISSG